MMSREGTSGWAAISRRTRGTKALRPQGMVKLAAIARGTDPPYAAENIGMTDAGTNKAPWLSLSVKTERGGFIVAQARVEDCLKRWGLSKADVTIKNMGQAEIISAMSSANADLGGLWAPNIYTLEEKAGARVLCTGPDLVALGREAATALLEAGDARRAGERARRRVASASARSCA